MTPLEILTAAASGQAAPRIPVFCNVLDQGAHELGLSLRDYYADGARVAEGQLRMRARYGHDNVWALSYVGREAELLGCKEILFADDGPPNVADFIIKNYDDIAKLDIPDDLSSHPAFAECAKCVRLLHEEVGDTHPICAYLTASATLPALLMGMDQWMELLLIGPTDVRDELLRKCSLFFRKEIAAYRAAGAHVLIYANPFGSTYFIDRKRFDQWAMPWMQRDLAEGIEGVVYYCGMAPFNDVIDTVYQNLGIGAYYISPLSDLAEAKRILGTRGLTCGVINDIEMIQWTPAQTRAEVKRLIDIGKAGGRFLLGTGVMPLGIPPANIHAFVDAAFEYGQYP